jgi:hypothetical protein
MKNPLATGKKSIKTKNNNKNSDLNLHELAKCNIIIILRTSNNSGLKSYHDEVDEK